MKLSQCVTHGLASAVFLVGCGLSSVASAANDVPANATYAPVRQCLGRQLYFPNAYPALLLHGLCSGAPSYCVEVQPNSSSIDVGFDSYTNVFRRYRGRQAVLSCR